jgi:putative NADPH-quinone reductase
MGGSFSHVIGATATGALEDHGPTVRFYDLYSERFDPVLRYDEIPRDFVLDPVIAQHCTEIVRADGIVIVPPNWWGLHPAILKGWVDRVIRPGTAYRYQEGDNAEGTTVALLKAKTALIFNTANTHAQ